jgi:4-hydroxy-tetrahydrodipicolinate synthase
MISIGAVGVISVIGNALPKQLSAMIRLCLERDYDAALPAHLNLLEITRLMFSEGNPAGVKAALKQLNVCDDVVRLPLVKASSSLNKSLAEQLKALSLLA